MITLPLVSIAVLGHLGAAAARGRPQGRRLHAGHHGAHGKHKVTHSSLQQLLFLMCKCALQRREMHMLLKTSYLLAGWYSQLTMADYYCPCKATATHYSGSWHPEKDCRRRLESWDVVFVAARVLMLLWFVPAVHGLHSLCSCHRTSTEGGLIRRRNEQAWCASPLWILGLPTCSPRHLSSRCGR